MNARSKLSSVSFAGARCLSLGFVVVGLAFGLTQEARAGTAKPAATKAVTKVARVKTATKPQEVLLTGSRIKRAITQPSEMQTAIPSITLV